MKKLLLGACMAMVLGAGFVYAESEVWQQGGLATNQVSKGTATAQKTLTYALAAMGLAANTLSIVASLIPQGIPGVVTTEDGQVGSAVMGGNVTWGFNFDFLGLALDGILLNDAMTKKATLSEPIPELEASARQIGSKDELEGECDGDETGTCNEMNATLDSTDVYVSTLKNVGLEALEDVAGSVLKTPAELIGAASVIQTGFGSEAVDSDQKKTSGAYVPGSIQDYLPDYPDPYKGGAYVTNPTGQVTHTEADLEKIRLRRQAHFQYIGTAGVARADIGTAVARTEHSVDSDLSRFAGSGASVIANIKVLSGLDLTLSQRLNLLNMLQGQQVSNDAASALQYVEE